jgi:hypothetical protein
MSSPLWRVRSSSSRPGNGARSLWPVAVKVQAPSRWGMPRSQSRPAPPALEGGHDPAQLGVDAGAVVALVVVLGDQLPVGLDRVAQATAHAQRLQRIAAQPLGNEPELVGQGHRPLRGQVEEHEPAPGRHPDRVEPEGGLVEAVDLLAPGGAEQVALQPVGPGMVGAAQRPGLAGWGGLGASRAGGRAGDDLGATVAADVVVGPQFPRPGPDQQDALAGDLDHHQRPRPLDLVGPPGAEPLAEQQPFPLPLEGRPVEVPGRGQRTLEAGHTRSPPDLGPRTGRVANPGEGAPGVVHTPTEGRSSRLPHSPGAQRVGMGRRERTFCRRSARRRSFSIWRTTLRPGMPVTPPPPWVADPAW